MQQKKVTIFLIPFMLFIILLPNKLVFADTVGKSVNECLKDTSKCSNQSSTDSIKNQSNSSPIVTVWTVTKMILALAFVLILLYLLLKFINKKSRSYQHNRMIHNMGGTSLGGNRSVQIVKAGNSILLLGVGENIQLIKEITEEEVAQFMKQYNQELNQSTQAQDMISKAVQFLKEKKDSKQSPKHFSNMFKEKLESVQQERKKMTSQLQDKEQNKDE